MNRCDSEVGVDSDGCLWVSCQVDLKNIWFSAQGGDGDSLVMASITRVFCQAFFFYSVLSPSGEEAGNL